MEDIINELLSGYDIFFKKLKYDLNKLHKEFTFSEYYSLKDDKRCYDLNDFENNNSKGSQNESLEETFNDYIDKHLKNVTLQFKETLLDILKSCNSDKQQNALLFSLLANLQNYINILATTEEPGCKLVMANIEDSRDFILKLFSSQLGLTSDQKKSERKESLSTYFRGIEKLRFDLQKQEVVLLFTLMLDSRIMDFPCSDSDLAKFLELNVKYRNSEMNKYTSMSTALSTIDKLRNRTFDPEKLTKGLIKKLNISIHEIKHKK
jgi:hypothetical protein